MRKQYTKEEIYIDLQKISKERILHLFEIINKSGDALYVDDSIKFRKGLYIKNYPKLIFEHDKWICTKTKHKNRKELNFE